MDVPADGGGPGRVDCNVWVEREVRDVQEVYGDAHGGGDVPWEEEVRGGDGGVLVAAEGSGAYNVVRGGDEVVRGGDEVVLAAGGGEGVRGAGVRDEVSSDRVPLRGLYSP